MADHQNLFIVGHAFKREATAIEDAIREKRPIRVEFSDDEKARWPELQPAFEIRHLSNSIDPRNRTFDFFINLQNQSRNIEHEGHSVMVWRFRPGQRTRIDVPVERFDDVFVVPRDGVVRDGAESFVFRQNGELFKRISVHVLHEDQQHVVIAHDGSIAVGCYLAQNAAASLLRILKAQSNSGEQPGVHVHADGTVHAAH